MLSKNRSLRLVLFGAPVLALAAAALFLTIGPGSGERASAGTLQPGLNFSLGIDFNGDGTNDCGTGVPAAVGDGAPDAATADVSNTTCNVPAVGATLQVNSYLMNAGGIAYAGVTSQVNFTGITSNGIGTSVWTGHVFDATFSVATSEQAASAIGIAPAVPQTNLGLVNRFTFTCAASGAIHLAHGSGETSVTDNALANYREAGPDELTVNCGSVVGPTDTPPPAGTPTNTPTTGPTAVPTTPGPTATTGPTNTPTNTVPPTATRTRTPTPAISLCDVNGDGDITSEDGLWILWKEASIVDHVPLPENADCDENGRVNSIDALFILWIEGGRIPSP